MGKGMLGEIPADVERLPGSLPPWHSPRRPRTLEGEIPLKLSSESRLLIRSSSWRAPPAVILSRSSSSGDARGRLRSSASSSPYPMMWLIGVRRSWRSFAKGDFSSDTAQF